jgi:hypothetical protein
VRRKEKPWAELDGRYLSTEVASGFVGRTIGMYVSGGVAAFDWFEYQGSESGPADATITSYRAVRRTDSSIVTPFT